VREEQEGSSPQERCTGAMSGDRAPWQANVCWDYVLTANIIQQRIIPVEMT